MMAEGRLSATLSGRLAAWMWMVASVLALASQTIAPGAASRQITLGIGIGALLCGAGLWLVPWHRLCPQATMWLVPLAFGTIGLDYALADGNGFLYAVSFVMVFAWLGVSHRPGTCLKFTPLLVVGFATPLLLGPAGETRFGLASTPYVVVVSVMVGEAVAWAMSMLSRTRSALADTRERYSGVFEEAPMGIVTVSPERTLLRVNRAFADIVGSTNAELEGRSMQELIHPEDRAASDVEIRRLVAGEIDRVSLEKRLLRSDGGAVWVSVGTSCVRNRDGEPVFLIGQVEDITERRALREQLAYAAGHDELTGLPNRSLFMERLARTVARAEDEGRHVALMFIDLDRFKLINDGLGHDAGDRLLQRIARRLQRTLRSGDFLARFGGDEFTALCVVGDEQEALDVAQRLQATMAKPLADSDHEHFVSLSIGIALSSSASESGASMLRNADVAMYRSRESGYGRIAIYREDDELHSIRSLQISNELHRALERGELVLHYQPFVDLDDVSLVGLEALVRWEHPTRGLLAPGEFIPLAEECGLIVPLGTWVLREALRQGAAWTTERTRNGQDPWRLNVSVNVSPQQLVDPLFPQVVADAVAESGFVADQVWLEITESAILSDPQAAVEILGQLRRLGVHVSIDDFGTGYSSLSYLKHLPVEILKIDRSFVDQVDRDPDDRAIVSAVIAMSRSLGLTVIAEGIERPAQAERLTELGCRFAQGYFYGRPRSPEDMGGWPADDLRSWVTGIEYVDA